MMVPLPRGSMFGPLVGKVLALLELLALGVALAAGAMAVAYVLTLLGIA